MIKYFQYEFFFPCRENKSQSNDIWYRDLASYLVSLAVPKHAEFAIGYNLHTVALYSGRTEILVRHYILRVSGRREISKRGYLADFVNDLLAGGIHVPADQAVISWRDTHCAG